MLRNTLVSLVVALTVAACGGQIVGGDAGTGSDGSTTPTPTTSTSSNPPPPLCAPMQGGGTVSSDGTCSVSEDWACGATKYSVQCSCSPNGGTSQCSCSQFTANGGSGTTLPYNGCPSCTVTGKQLAQLCGFPSN